VVSLLGSNDLMNSVATGSMDQLLAVVEPTESARTLVRQAGEVAKATNAHLLLIHVTDALKYSSHRESMNSSDSNLTHYTRDEAEEKAAQLADEIGSEVLSDTAVEYNTAGYLGHKAKKVLEIANRRSCDRIFITGHNRSPTGKAIFGDTTQKIILDFDGSVTVNTDQD
jgi:nucleotide-binding universal stress UspA family protein